VNRRTRPEPRDELARPAGFRRQWLTRTSRFDQRGSFVRTELLRIPPSPREREGGAAGVLPNGKRRDRMGAILVVRTGLSAGNRRKLIQALPLRPAEHAKLLRKARRGGKRAARASAQDRRLTWCCRPWWDAGHRTASEGKRAAPQAEGGRRVSAVKSGSPRSTIETRRFQGGLSAGRRRVTGPKPLDLGRRCGTCAWPTCSIGAGEGAGASTEAGAPPNRRIGRAAAGSGEEMSS